MVAFFVYFLLARNVPRYYQAQDNEASLDVVMSSAAGVTALLTSWQECVMQGEVVSETLFLFNLGKQSLFLDKVRIMSLIF